MKPFLAAALAGLIASAAAMPAAAGPFQVNFEKSWDYANGDVNQYYAGGTAADGTSGPNVGVSFVNVSGLSNDQDFTYYRNAPSMQGTAYAHTFAPDERAFMDVAHGVVGALSFWYSSPSAAMGAVRAWSGLGGTGTLLGTLDLAANSSTDYDTWTQVFFDFAGVARSFDLTGSANLVALDDIGGTQLPEPTVLVLLMMGGAAALCVRGRRRG